MSAACRIKFSQPLAAVKAYANNTATLIDCELIAEASSNVSSISSPADRMASTKLHLINFAPKPNQKLGLVTLDEVVRDTEKSSLGASRPQMRH